MATTAAASVLNRGGGSAFSFLQTAVANNWLGNSVYTMSKALSNLGGTGVVLVSFAYSSRAAYPPTATASLVITLGGVPVGPPITNFAVGSWRYVGPVVVVLPLAANPNQQGQALLEFQLMNAGTSAINIDNIIVTAACPANFYSLPGTAGTCTACPLYSTSAPGSNACTCNAGFSASGVGASFACACLPGSLVAGSGAATTCTACPVNTYSAATSDASCAACTTADPNAVAPSTGSATCGCAQGFTASGSGATLRCTCAAGSMLSGGGSVCTPCAPGTFSSAAASPSCTPCAANTYAAAAGASVCVACPAGSAGLSPTGSSGCACTNNFFISGTGATLACSACPSGSRALSNSTTCTCLSGFKANGASGAALKCNCPLLWLTGGSGSSATCAPPPAAGALTSGNLVALRVGDGSAALTSALAPVFLDEFTPTGALVQSIATPITLSGSDPTVGALTRSANGVYAMFTGIANVGSGQQPGASAPFFGVFANRSVARFDASGVLDVSTTFSAASYNGVVRSACSADGSFYLLLGNATSGAAAGVASAPHGGGSADIASALAGQADFSACFATAGSLLLARAVAGAPMTGGTLVASGTMPGAAGATLAAPTALNGGMVITQPFNPSYFATQLAATASGSTIFVADLQSAGPPAPPNPSIWLSTDAGTTFNPFAVGLTVTGLQISGDEKTLYFATPGGLYSAAAACAPLPCTTIVPLGAAAAAGKEFRGLALVPCRAGQYGTYCTPCARGTFSAVVGAATCAGACPAGATTSNAGQTSDANCYCMANFFRTSATGAALACSPCPADSNSTASATTCTCANPWANFDAPSGTCILPPSSTPTAAASVTPSTTSTASLTPTISTTSTASLSASPSLTSTPSLTRTPSPSSTVSVSSTPSQSPSPTSVPDVLLRWKFAITPTGTILRVSDVIGQRSVMTSIVTGFASLLGVPASAVVIANVTDVATGLSVQPASRRLAAPRALAGAGSLGVSVSMLVNLG